MNAFLKKLPGVDELKFTQQKRLKELYDLHHDSFKEGFYKLNAGDNLPRPLIQQIIKNIHASGPIMTILCQTVQDPCLLKILSQRYKIELLNKYSVSIPVIPLTSFIKKPYIKLLHENNHYCIYLRNQTTIIKTNPHNQTFIKHDIELLKKVIAIGVDSLHCITKNQAVINSVIHFIKKHVNMTLFDSFQDTCDKLIHDFSPHNGIIDACVRYLKHIIKSLQRKADFQHDTSMVEALMVGAPVGENNTYKTGVDAKLISVTILKDSVELKFSQPIQTAKADLVQCRKLFFQLLNRNMSHLSFMKSIVSFKSVDSCSSFIAFSDHSELVKIKPSETDAIKESVEIVNLLVSSKSIGNSYTVMARQVTQWVYLLSLFLNGSYQYKLGLYHRLLCLYRDTIKEPLTTTSLLSLLNDFKFRCIEGFVINYTILFSTMSYIELL